MTAEAENRKTDRREENKAQLVSLYDEYYDKIAHYVYVRIGDKAEAEDIASEVFLKALESLKKYEERGVPMQAWLFKIAHNLVVDHLRKVTKYKIVPIETVEIKSEADPQSSAEMNIELQRVTKVMGQLTEDQAEVLRLRFFGGLKSWEAGNIMGKSEGAVREMQRAALEKLRQLLNTG